MSIVEQWVIEAIEKLRLEHVVRRCEIAVALDVLNRVADRFLDQSNPRFWWEHLRSPAERWQIENAFEYLPKLVADSDVACYFIAGLDGDVKAVFRCTTSLATSILGECPPFEYAVVDPDLRWILIENHHDVLFAAGDARELMIRLRA